MLTVVPGDPPATDVVLFDKVELKACVLRVRATGSNPDAILSVHLTSSGSRLMVLENLGGGEYEGERVFRPSGTNLPVDLTLRSNFGGTDQASVSDPQAFKCRADL